MTRSMRFISQCRPVTGMYTDMSVFVLVCHSVTEKEQREGGNKESWD